ncbi:TetR/AcrR family transcriptional regulator C-terminal domain-containing protein [Glycomyces mayteni]|uniref:TetR/AcrR family transcriptional regulator C-terminal domain-containing protein n=1 Tax=Glycomyces mayteni TaxID=543887 RepID=A0ABW2D288_9ACTN|nr:TetR/AcrR family transcriptional regulator C-terminal domain-containing protein [Glycomyces mayteni]
MPHPRQLERSAIVAATLAVLDERGLDALSLHAIAKHLGVRQPALYHHFPSKAALLDAAAAEVLDRRHTERVPRDGETWRDFLARNARSLRTALLAVRDGARLIAATGPRAPEPAATLARIDCFAAQGVGPADAILASIAVSRYVIGCVLEEQSAPATPPPPTPESTRLHAITATLATLTPDREFDTGLEALIRGLEPR